MLAVLMFRYIRHFGEFVVAIVRSLRSSSIVLSISQRSDRHLLRDWHNDALFLSRIMAAEYVVIVFSYVRA